MISREEIKQWYKDSSAEEFKYKYFVLKIDDWIDSLSETEIQIFFNMLESYNQFLNKEDIPSFWVIDRAKVPHIKSYAEFINKLS